ncbi:MAG: hypothetical protein M1823_003754 [Watsoniomyces obsoletus]|nr:MAG: hypothetical protein M1823_003754 [Watsoniomyces obsoletus]
MARKKKTPSTYVTGSQFRRAQEYLGLRAVDGGGQDARQVTTTLSPSSSGQKSSTSTSTTTTTTTNRAGGSGGSASTPSLRKTKSFTGQLHDYNRPVPFPTHLDIVFIALDVECYERDHSCVTEIGIATLDVRDIRGQGPGKEGKKWREAIRSHHYLIKEFAHLRNKDFVNDSRDGFEFGTSEWISYKDAPQMVATSFRPGVAGPLVEHEPNDAQRNVVIVGHAVEGDLNFLQGLGYNARQLNNVVDVLDVGVIDRDLKGDTQSRALGAIIYDLGIIGWHLHNAGNDAVYSLQGLLAMVVRYQHGIKEAVVIPKSPVSDGEVTDSSDFEDMGRAWEVPKEEEAESNVEQGPMTEEW